MPEASIFTYDWNPSYFEDALVQTLLGHADSLLAHTKDNQSCSKRPIIFVASCFGGLVLAEALTRAAQKGSLYLFDRRHHFPCNTLPGRQRPQGGPVAGDYRRYHREETSDRLVHDLDQRYDFFLERVQRFVEVANADPIRLPIRCFYETKKTEILRRVLSSGWAAMLSTCFTHKTVRLPLLPFLLLVLTWSAR